MKLIDVLFTNNPYYLIIISFLSLKDNKKLLLLNKKINSYLKNCRIRKVIMYDIYTNIIVRLFQKYKSYINVLQSDTFINLYIENKVVKKMNAFYYFRFYQKQHIQLWYNLQVGWKKNILDKYKKKKIDNPSRYDLYHFIKKIDVEETSMIGW